jgi:ADP-ribose pyrophosphatase YjhB (NUDIX family)
VSSLPHTTVATVIEREGKFLLVREKSDGLIVYNQPAGHLENNETLLEAAIRETLEETSWHIELIDFLGVYQYTSPVNGICYVRHCFVAKVLEQQADYALDEDIIDAVWLTLEEIRERVDELRSPLVLQVVKDYLAGTRFPLSILRNDQA